MKRFGLRSCAAFGLAVLCLAGNGPACADDFFGSLAVMFRLSRIAPDGQRKTLRTFTLLDAFEPPDVQSWIVTPYKNPPTPFTEGECAALTRYMDKFQIDRLSFADQETFGDAQAAQLSELSTLTFIDLNGTGVTDAGLLAFKKCPHLQSLGALAPGISATGVQGLERALGHSLERVPLVKKGSAAPAAPDELVTASGVHYSNFGPAPGSRIDGSYPRGKAWMDSQWTLYDLNGKPVTIGSKKGQVLFLNFWATWCGYCIKEMPSIDALANGLQGQNIFFACITREDAATVRQYLAKHPSTIPVYTIKELPSGGVFSDGIPATYIVAKPGDIAVRFIGSRQWDTSEIIQYLLMLSSEKIPPSGMGGRRGPPLQTP